MTCRLPVFRSYSDQYLWHRDGEMPQRTGTPALGRPTMQCTGHFPVPPSPQAAKPEVTVLANIYTK